MRSPPSARVDRPAKIVRQRAGGGRASWTRRRSISTCPAGLIAQDAVEPRDRSRLMVVRRASGTWEHRAFADLPDLLEPGDVLVRNNTRVDPRPAGRRPRGDRRALGGALPPDPRPTARGRSWRRPGAGPSTGERVVVGSGLRPDPGGAARRGAMGGPAGVGRGGRAAPGTPRPGPAAPLHPQGGRGGRATGRGIRRSTPRCPARSPRRRRACTSRPRSSTGSTAGGSAGST